HRCLYFKYSFFITWDRLCDIEQFDNKAIASNSGITANELLIFITLYFYMQFERFVVHHTIKNVNINNVIIFIFIIMRQILSTLIIFSHLRTLFNNVAR